MPSAIGGLTPEYRGADIRCGLNERLGCGRRRHWISQLRCCSIPSRLQWNFCRDAAHIIEATIAISDQALITNHPFAVRLSEAPYVDQCPSPLIFTKTSSRFHLQASGTVSG